MNSTPIGHAQWATGDALTLQLPIPEGVLAQGSNTITVRCGVGLVAGQYDIVFVNRFIVGFPHPYTAIQDRLTFSSLNPGIQELRVSGFSQPSVDIHDITDPLAPVRVVPAVIADDSSYTLAVQVEANAQPRRFLALGQDSYSSVDLVTIVEPSSLRSSSLGADYIVIAHSDFVDSLDPLIQMRQSEGLRVRVVDVQQVYDAFGYGIVDAEAIRGFLAFVYEYWPRPAPTYVLLVGDGNYDPRNYMGRGETSFVPPYLADADPWMGETAADNRYVAVHGSDIFPDMFLGRLPAKSVADVQAMVGKILAYETSSGGWQSALSFIADNPDSAGDFRSYSDAIIGGYLPRPYTSERIYIGISPYTTSSVTKSAILSAINDGRLLVNYVGHSSMQFWASEIVLHINDAPLLVNTVYPFMAPMTCWEGYYINPPYDTGGDSSFV